MRAAELQIERFAFPEDETADQHLDPRAALKQQVSERLAAHRSRRSRRSGENLIPIAEPEPKPVHTSTRPRANRIASAVAERYAQTPSPIRKPPLVQLKGCLPDQVKDRFDECSTWNAGAGYPRFPPSPARGLEPRLGNPDSPARRPRSACGSTSFKPGRALRAIWKPRAGCSTWNMSIGRAALQPRPLKTRPPV